MNSIFTALREWKEGRINDRMIIRRNSDELKTELERICTQIIKLQKKRLGQKDKIAFAHYRISDLEQIIEKIQALLEAQAATVASASNPNWNTGLTGTPELPVLCPNIVPNAEKLVEVFINGLPRSIEGNVTASKPNLSRLEASNFGGSH
ncbi:hypothetical protein Tco_1144046 [Tanacetum coccineum]